MKKNIVLFVIGLVLLAFTPANATPSTYIWIPALDIQPFLNPHFGWDSYVTTYQGTLPGVTLNGGLTMGVLPFKKVQMEVGVDFRDNNGLHTYPFLFNAKIGTPEDAFFPYQPGVVAGMYDVGFVKDLNSYNIAYGLIGKTIWKLGRFSIGGYKGGVGADPKALFYVNSDTNTVNRKVSDAGIMAAWDRMMPEISDKLWLCVDYQSGYSGYGALNFGFAWYFTPNVSVIYGYDIYMDGEALKPTATVQVDINLF
jgi:hypothetical protein